MDSDLQDADSIDELDEPGPGPYVCPWSVIIDTREQAPYRFTGLTSSAGKPIIVPLITDRALKSGDYSIEGFETRVAVERKSVSDWLGSITAGRARFEREMERLSEMDFAAVVIEGDLTELLVKTPIKIAATVQGTIAAWAVRYGVHFFPCLHRRHAEIWTWKLLEMWWRQEQRRVAKTKTTPQQ